MFVPSEETEDVMYECVYSSVAVERILHFLDAPVWFSAILSSLWFSLVPPVCLAHSIY